MAVEEPVGFTKDGKLITSYRFTEADLADIGMANELYQASPDGQQLLRNVLDRLRSVRCEIGGYFDDGRS